MMAADPNKRRTSRLLAQASSLPSVEHALDEFIARANETEPDILEVARRDEEEKHKELEALRRHATEQQLRESVAREQSLRRQLDGLQGQLAEAEARAAVASVGGSQDGIIADLKLRLTAADGRAQASEEYVAKLAEELVSARAAATPVLPPAPEVRPTGESDELEQRLRIAEAKAAKAIAAAKAASLGLTVNAADLAAIEDGLSVPPAPSRKLSSWGVIAAALVMGGAIASTAAFVLRHRQDATSGGAASAAPAEQERAHVQPAAPARPIVTPIDEPTTAPPVGSAQPAATNTTGARDTVVPTPAGATKPAHASERPAAVAKPEAASATPAFAATPDPAPAPATTEAPTQRAVKRGSARKTTGSAASDEGRRDAAPASSMPAKPAADGPPSGGIVDPF